MWPFKCRRDEDIDRLQKEVTALETFQYDMECAQLATEKVKEQTKWLEILDAAGCICSEIFLDAMRQRHELSMRDQARAFYEMSEKDIPLLSKTEHVEIWKQRNPQLFKEQE